MAFYSIVAVYYCHYGSVRHILECCDFSQWAQWYSKVHNICDVILITHKNDLHDMYCHMLHFLLSLMCSETYITFGLPSDIMSDHYEIWLDTVAKPWWSAYYSTE